MIAVRVATSADAGIVAGLEAIAARHPWSPRAIAEALGSPRTIALLAERDGTPCGHLLAQAVADEGELHTVGVDPGARRRGVGHALLSACEQAWRDAGAVRAFLEVAADNGPARALYAARGWTEVGARRAYYPDGQDAILLAWDVSHARPAGRS